MIATPQSRSFHLAEWIVASVVSHEEIEIGFQIGIEFDSIARTNRPLCPVPVMAR